MARGMTRPVVVLLTGLVVLALVAGSAGAQPSDEPSIVVTLDTDGSAEVVLTLTYDLETDSEQAAFEELQANETAREQARTRFRNRLAAVAHDAENATGREMTIDDAGIVLTMSDDGTTGIVALSVTWHGLAAVEADRLVVTEPFASSFQPDRPFVVKWPDEYDLASATPDPASKTATHASWETDTALGGFELTIEETATSAAADETPTDADGVGFGSSAALLALAVAAAVLLRRSS